MHMKKRKMTKITAASIIAGALMSCSFVPQENEPEDVYGPPVEDVDDPKESEEPIETPDSEYNSDENITDPVYGPPDDEYDPVENELEGVYGPPND